MDGEEVKGLRKHYIYTTTRSSLWTAHRADRDRTAERIELGQRVMEARRAQ